MQFKNGFWHRIEMKTYSNYLKGLNQNFKRLKEILTQEMNKMPLGAKLTKKWPNWYFLKWILTWDWNKERLKQFSKIKMSWMQETTKIPFYVNFANNIEIKCRERCNWSETYQMTYNARKEELNKYF